MNLSLIYTLLLALTLSNTEVQVQQLLGKWQLVYFDGIDRVKNSPQYLSSDTAMRTNIEYKIKSRLENTVYDFFHGDSLAFTDYENNTIVKKKAKIKVDSEKLLTIFDGKETRQAKIIELSPTKLVIEPVSKNSQSGKMVFERILTDEKK